MCGESFKLQLGIVRAKSDLLPFFIVRTRTFGGFEVK